MSSKEIIQEAVSFAESTDIKSDPLWDYGIEMQEKILKSIRTINRNHARQTRSYKEYLNAGGAGPRWHYIDLLGDIKKLDKKKKDIWEPFEPLQYPDVEEYPGLFNNQKQGERT